LLISVVNYLSIGNWREFSLQKLNQRFKHAKNRIIRNIIGMLDEILAINGWS
jgi:hypothetical protein